MTCYLESRGLVMQPGSAPTVTEVPQDVSHRGYTPEFQGGGRGAVRHSIGDQSPDSQPGGATAGHTVRARGARTGADGSRRTLSRANRCAVPKARIGNRAAAGALRAYASASSCATFLRQRAAAATLARFSRYITGNGHRARDGPRAAQLAWSRCRPVDRRGYRPLGWVTCGAAVRAALHAGLRTCAGGAQPD